MLMIMKCFASEQSFFLTFQSEKKLMFFLYLLHIPIFSVQNNLMLNFNFFQFTYWFSLPLIQKFTPPEYINNFIFQCWNIENGICVLKSIIHDLLNPIELAFSFLFTQAMTGVYLVTFLGGHNMWKFKFPVVDMNCSEVIEILMYGE